jgi:hypothetical protein
MANKARAFLMGALLIAAVPPAKAQTTNQQWTIVATTETVPAAAPVQFDRDGNPISCSGQDPDVASSGSCFNPLTFTFDLVAPSSGTFGPTNAATLSAPDGLNLLSITNYAGSQDGGVTSIRVVDACSLLCGLGGETDACTITITNEDGSTFIFVVATVGGDPMTATFTSLGGSSGLDSGTASVYRNSMPVPQGGFAGSFENSNTDSISISFAGSQSNFSLNPVSVTPVGNANACFTGTFSSSDPLALTYDANYNGWASGDVIALTVGDGLGDVIYMQVTPDVSSTGAFQDPDDTAGTEYVTFFVLASSNSSCPVGLTAYDAPFRRALSKIIRPPYRLKWPTGPMPVERLASAPASSRPISPATKPLFTERQPSLSIRP